MDLRSSPNSKESSFLLSALTKETRFQSMDEFMAWFESRSRAHRFSVRQIPFDALDKWYFEEGTQNLVHASGKFFRIEGIRVHTNFGSVKTWDQPIISQPEIGILGIISKKINGIKHFLMQAKMEPGNVNIIQLSPTVQATRSNYTQVHTGKKPIYLEYFLDRTKSKILIDQLQPEQGSRFLRKRNRNMIVEVDEDVELYDDFCWLTLGQIKQLLTVDNFVNMDARSVLSCIPFIDRDLQRSYESSKEAAQLEALDPGLKGLPRDLFISIIDREHTRHGLDEIVNWFTEMKAKYELRVERIGLKDVSHWIRSDREIFHESEQFFSVIAVSVQAGNREVINWTQPLLKHTSYGIVGFLAKKIDGILHFLVQAKVEPGNFDIADMAPTVSCSGAEQRCRQANGPPFLDMFMNALPHQIRYCAIQSEEGGRFYHFQNKYMVIEVEPSYFLEIPENYIWMTLGQIIEFTRHSYFNIEARGLLACLSLL